jgi:outer membrane lipoprotein SlyB
MKIVKNFNYKSVVLSSMVGLSLLSGCTQSLGGSDYQYGDVGQVSTAHAGTIVSVRKIKIQGRGEGEQGRAGAGTVAGGVGGAVLGSLFGKGGGSALGALVGAAGGATAGYFAEKKLSEQDGFEYTVKLDSGETTVVTQGAEPSLRPGQRVNIVSGSQRGIGAKMSRARVVPL